VGKRSALRGYREVLMSLRLTYRGCGGIGAIVTRCADKGLRGQPAIIAEEEAYWEEIREEIGSDRGDDLPIHWGDHHLWVTRRRHHRLTGGGRVSQERLAEAISAVVPCTARHISRLEHSKERPEDLLQLKRAMLATIFLGLDPIWNRYNLRLTRWDCGDITMEEARLLNPDWADLVDHINQLLHQMPPRWHVEGAR
jgi:hypothetical protein